MSNRNEAMNGYRGENKKLPEVMGGEKDGMTSVLNAHKWKLKRMKTEKNTSELGI